MIKIFKLGILIFASMFLTMCQSIDSTQELDSENPNVLSYDTSISVESWQYLSPEELPQTDLATLSEGSGIDFGNESQQASIVWNETGFDLYWSELPCATRPILLLEDGATLKLSGGKWRPAPPECNAVESFHAFKVSLSSPSMIPSPNEWTYLFTPSQQ